MESSTPKARASAVKHGLGTTIMPNETETSEATAADPALLGERTWDEIQRIFVEWANTARMSSTPPARPRGRPGTATWQGQADRSAGCGKAAPSCSVGRPGPDSMSGGLDERDGGARDGSEGRGPGEGANGCPRRRGEREIMNRHDNGSCSPTLIPHVETGRGRPPAIGPVRPETQPVVVRPARRSRPAPTFPLSDGRPS